MAKTLVYLILISQVIVAGCAEAGQSGIGAPCKNHLRSHFVSTYSDEESFSGPVRSIHTERQNYEWELGSFFYFRNHDFDTKGRKIAETELAADRVPFLSRKLEYDDNGVLTREIGFAGLPEDETPIGETIYAYNEDGTINEIKDVIRDSLDGRETVLKGVFSNDLKGNYYEFRREAEAGSSLQLGIQRDEKCRISAIYDIGRLGSIGLWSTKTAFSYDENNTLIGMKRYAPLGILLEERRYEYEFDDKANWIKKSEFARREEGGKSDWKLIGEEARAIKYYD